MFRFKLLPSSISVRPLLPLLAGVFVGYLCVYELRNTSCENTGIIASLNSLGGIQFVTWTNKSSPRVLCFLNTYPKDFAEKTVHVQNTWARRCTETVFTTTMAYPGIRVLKLDLGVPETRDHLWTKLRMSLSAVYREMGDFDYYYRADDDTYAFVENLYAVLKKQNTTRAYMTGFRFTHEPLTNHFGGGGGYVFPREVLKRLVEQSIGRHDNCPSHDGWKDDLYVCACAKAVGVQLLDSLDEGGRSLFYCYNITEYFTINRPSSVGTAIDNPYIWREHFTLGPDHISFHYMRAFFLYLCEFVGYHLRPVGVEDDKWK